MGDTEAQDQMEYVFFGSCTLCVISFLTDLTYQTCKKGGVAQCIVVSHGYYSISQEKLPFVLICMSWPLKGIRDTPKEYSSEKNLTHYRFHIFPLPNDENIFIF